jgi:hypothetical protein
VGVVTAVVPVRQAVPELDSFDACFEEALAANAINVPAHDPADLMLDASVSLDAATLAASDVDVHYRRQTPRT